MLWRSLRSLVLLVVVDGGSSEGIFNDALFLFYFELLDDVFCFLCFKQK